MFDSLSITGVEEAIKVLASLPAEVRTAIETEGLPQGGEVIASEMRTNCPKDKGALEASIKVSKVQKKGPDRLVVHVTAGDKEAWYAGPVEFGHFAGARRLGNDRSFVPAHPFVRPSFDTKKNEAVARIRAAVVEALNKRSL